MSRILKLIIFISLICTPDLLALPSIGTTDVFYSPKGGCTVAIVKEINQAKSEILIQAYSFTSKPISQALLDAYKRKVNILIILDKSQEQEKYCIAPLLYNSGVSIVIDSKHVIAHNKIIIIDQKTLITGSFNFSASAESSNAENLLIMKDNKLLIDSYINNFKLHQSHTIPYSIPILSGITK